MKRFILLSLMLLQGVALCRAQSSGLIPVNVSTVYADATGSKMVASYVLWPESFAGTGEAEELYGAIDYYTGVASGQNPKVLLDRAVGAAVNHKVYHGVMELGHGFWAVSESANEDGPAHKCLGGWGVINRSGGKVADFKYELIVEFDKQHGIIKYGSGYRSGKVLFGLLHLNGTPALPCEYAQIFFSEGNYITAVYPDASKACLYDWDMNPLPIADICYSEPWTRGGSDCRVTYYPAIDRKGKVGVYDDNGRLVVPFKYDRCYARGEYWIGINGAFPRKVNDFSVSYDHIDSPTPERRYDIHTWKCLDE